MKSISDIREFYARQEIELADKARKIKKCIVDIKLEREKEIAKFLGFKKGDKCLYHCARGSKVYYLEYVGVKSKGNMLGEFGYSRSVEHVFKIFTKSWKDKNKYFTSESLVGIELIK